MLGDPRHDMLFCGYQAAGTPGRDIQAYGSKPGGYVQLDGQRFDIRAGILTLGGFSAHADQKDLLNFMGRTPQPPRQARIVHGDDGAKARLAERIRTLNKGLEVVAP